MIRNIKFCITYSVNNLYKRFSQKSILLKYNTLLIILDKKILLIISLKMSALKLLTFTHGYNPIFLYNSIYFFKTGYLSFLKIE